ncbi:unnamed protein product [Leptidea sinapis]|uniref:Uncharacterized protein n=1 Tax=Leptidea sinapis TaxID=189913 RepID=A0A5E4PM02_9NEOP|nr:unnamed protein product [Leptidea sinapis]
MKRSNAGEPPTGQDQKSYGSTVWRSTKYVHKSARWPNSATATTNVANATTATAAVQSAIHTVLPPTSRGRKYKSVVSIITCVQSNICSQSKL